MVHTRQCSLIKSENRHDMVYLLFCDKIFLCAMPPDIAGDVQVKNRENLKISPVQLSSPVQLPSPVQLSSPVHVLYYAVQIAYNIISIEAEKTTR